MMPVSAFWRFGSWGLVRRVLIAVAILASWLSMVPEPAEADPLPSITVNNDPTSVVSSSGDGWDILGTDFPATSNVLLKLHAGPNCGGATYVQQDVITDGSGNFHVQLPNGTYPARDWSIQATDFISSFVSNCVYLQLTTTRTLQTPTLIQLGSNLPVEGSGFTPGGTVIISIEQISCGYHPQSVGSLLLGITVADANGEISDVLSAHSIISGGYFVYAYESPTTAASACSSVAIQNNPVPPSITVNGSTGPITVLEGENLAIAGSQFFSNAIAHVEYFVGSLNCIGVDQSESITLVSLTGQLTDTRQTMGSGPQSIRYLDFLGGVTNCVGINVIGTDDLTATAVAPTLEAEATQTAVAGMTATIDAQQTEIANMTATTVAGDMTATSVAADLTATIDAQQTEVANMTATTVTEDMTATVEAQQTEVANMTATTVAADMTATVETQQTEDAITTTSEAQTATVAALETESANQTATTEALATESANQTATTEAVATESANQTATAMVTATVTSSPTQEPTSEPTATDIPHTGVVELQIQTSDGGPIPPNTVVCLEDDCRNLDGISASALNAFQAGSGVAVMFGDLATGTYAVTVTIDGALVFTGSLEVVSGETSDLLIVLEGDEPDEASPVAPTATDAVVNPAPPAAPVVVLPNTGTGQSSLHSPMLLVLLAGLLVMGAGAVSAGRLRNR